jgi:hypothetical protein
MVCAVSCHDAGYCHGHDLLGAVRCLGLSHRGGFRGHETRRIEILRRIRKRVAGPFCPMQSVKSGLSTSQPCISCRIDVVILLFNRQVPFGASYNHGRKGRESGVQPRGRAMSENLNKTDRQLCGQPLGTKQRPHEPMTATSAIAALSFAPKPMCVGLPYRENARLGMPGSAGIAQEADASCVAFL